VTSIRARAVSVRLALERATARAAAREAEERRRQTALDQFDRDFLPTARVAALLSVVPTTLRRWRRCARGPRFVRLGEAQQARVRYPRREVEQFMADPRGYERAVREGDAAEVPS
jgi:transposase-like protein